MCNECLVTTHKPPEHSHDRISEDDKENDHVKELASLVNESKTKMNLCNEATSSLDGSLRDLQMQRDNARGLIQETFQSYKAVLEKRQVHDLLKYTSVCVNAIFYVHGAVSSIVIWIHFNFDLAACVLWRV